MSRARSSRLVEPAVGSLVISLVYVLVFGAQFLFNDLAPGGDTQTLWSFYYIAVYSLRHFHEFLWWDPTALNGWPAYYLAYYGWSSLMSPFQLGQLLFGELLGVVLGISINETLLIQKTLLVVVINIVGIVLISAELIQDRIARMFPPLVYALCHMQFLGYAAAGTVDALPAAIFLLYALVHYNNRRTPASLNVLILFAGIYLGSMNYMLLQSHVYALGFFALLIGVFFPGLLSSLWHNVTHLGRSRAGLACLGVGLLFMLSGVATFLAGVRPNLPNFARLKSGTIPYDILRENAWDPPSYAITSTEAWTNLFSWIPYSDFHAFSMKFDPYSSGLDYRYIGLATLPLIVIALVRCARNRYAPLFALTFFLCAAFITYTWLNLPFSLLITNTSVFKNIRTMAAVMPRDLVGLFPIFVAGIGLDLLLAGGAHRADTLGRSERAMSRLIIALLSILIAAALACLVLLATVPGLASVRKSLGHIGIYLLLFSGIASVLQSTTDESFKRPLALVLMILVFTDLTISASEQWINNNIDGRYYHSKGTVYMKAEDSGIGPIISEAGSWPGPNYSGMVHNMVHGGPYFGLKYWVALVTRPAWQPVLDTWNPATRMVTRYPYFKFFTNGAFIPENSITAIDSVPLPAIERPGKMVILDRRPVIRLDGRVHPIVTGMAGFVESVSLSAAWGDRYWFGGWAVDTRAQKPARLVFVFVGNDLWHVGSPTDSRPDVGSSNRALLTSGFGFNAPKLPQAALDGKTSVRVFALMQDNTAVEMRYSKGYPFSTDPRSPPATPDEQTTGNGSTHPMFYVHDPSLVLPGTAGRRLYDVHWEILKFTLNRVKLRVRLPEPAYMLSLDNYDRFWTARVNGRKVRVHRANFTFKTILLPAGESTVEWIYNPYRVKIAWTVFYLLLAGFLGTVWSWGRRQRPRRS